jgi:hypothetical protein
MLHNNPDVVAKPFTPHNINPSVARLLPSKTLVNRGTVTLF